MCDRFPPIEERQEGSGDRDEIRETEHALLNLPRHRAELLQENAAREPAREAPDRPDEPQSEDEIPVEVMRYDGDDADEPLDKACLYLHLRDFVDLGMLETEEGDQDDADAGAEETGVGTGRERRGLEGALRDALRQPGSELGKRDGRDNGREHPALVQVRDDHYTKHRANDERHGPEEVPEPVYLLPVRNRGADAAEEGADLEVPDDGTIGDAREEELQERDGDEEPAADDDGEDADDEAAPEEQRRLARKQPRRDRANPREIDHGASPAKRIRRFEYCLSSTGRPALLQRRRLLERRALTGSSQSPCSSEG
jgi:hypothetical protein